MQHTVCTITFENRLILTPVHKVSSNNDQTPTTIKKAQKVQLCERDATLKRIALSRLFN